MILSVIAGIPIIYWSTSDLPPLNGNELLNGILVIDFPDWPEPEPEPEPSGEWITLVSNVDTSFPNHNKFTEQDSSLDATKIIGELISKNGGVEQRIILLEDKYRTYNTTGEDRDLVTPYVTETAYTDYITGSDINNDLEIKFDLSLIHI